MTPEVIAITAVGGSLGVLMVSLGALIVAVFQTLNRRLDSFEQRFTVSEQRTDQRFTVSEQRTDQRFTASEQRTDQRFTASEERMDQRFTASEERMDQRFMALEERIDQRFTSFEERFSALEQRQARLEGIMESIRDVLRVSPSTS